MTAKDSTSRRRSLLASLAMMETSTARVRALMRELEIVHGMMVSADLVRGDLQWLDEQGLVRFVDDMAQATERGQDVVRMAAPWPVG
jgi:hypothetical protein